jgi:hypothetical protein
MFRFQAMEFRLTGMVLFSRDWLANRLAFVWHSGQSAAALMTPTL